MKTRAVRPEPSMVKSNFCQWPRLLARKVSSSDAARHAPESDLYLFIATMRNSVFSFFAFSGVRSADIEELRAVLVKHLIPADNRNVLALIHDHSKLFDPN